MMPAAHSRYRVREYTEQEMAARVSKDVRSVRLFEQALLTQYQVSSKRFCLCVPMYMFMRVKIHMCAC